MHGTDLGDARLRGQADAQRQRPRVVAGLARSRPHCGDEPLLSNKAIDAPRLAHQLGEARVKLLESCKVGFTVGPLARSPRHRRNEHEGRGLRQVNCHLRAILVHNCRHPLQVPGLHGALGRAGRGQLAPGPEVVQGHRVQAGDEVLGTLLLTLLLLCRYTGASYSDAKLLPSILFAVAVRNHEHCDVRRGRHLPGWIDAF
mmetsp:Transcript_106680/g.311836  ORF Transcript_106680/g.311836 Transcript_106680/m.311836 type:complete len:201 (+) Transcript_106680:550-1152(+)